MAALNFLQHVMHAPTAEHVAMAKDVIAMLYQKRHAGITYHGRRSKFWNSTIDQRNVPDNKKEQHEKLQHLVRVPQRRDVQFLTQTIAAYDSNYGGNGEKEKPQLCAVAYIAGGPTMWKSTKSKLYCTSTCEAELCAAHLCSQLVIYQIKILNELRYTQHPVIMLGDNQSCTIVLNKKHPSRAERHFRVRADHIRGCVDDELLTFQDIPSAFNPADSGSKVIQSPEMWKYLAALLHGKIRIGTPREDVTVQYLRELTETAAFHVPECVTTTATDSEKPSTTEPSEKRFQRGEPNEDGGVT